MRTKSKVKPLTTEPKAIMHKEEFLALQWAVKHLDTACLTHAGSERDIAEFQTNVNMAKLAIKTLHNMRQAEQHRAIRQAYKDALANKVDDILKENFK